MLITYNEQLESRNYIDDVNFDFFNPCIWVVYPCGAAGDLLSSIINSHYINTGSKYFGINNNGQVIFRPSDNKVTSKLSQQGSLEFNDNWKYLLADQLAEKNLNYSIVDQLIFSCHLYLDNEVQHLLDTFPQGKIIKINILNLNEFKLAEYLSQLKNKNIKIDVNNITEVPNELTSTIETDRVLNVRFCDLLEESKFELMYDRICTFLNFPSKLIRFDFINFWKQKQPKEIQYLIDQIINDTK